ncbi:MAG: hypothetical protein Q7J04_05125, partial [Microcella sp.]|nr:hypothetical protein [Microcella sp.]
CSVVGTAETAPSALTSPPTATSGPVSGDDRAGIAPPVAPVAATLPSGVDPSSDAALAWRALMSPVGEYAAAASYLAVLDRFGTVEPYATILQGELRHIDALTRQLSRAGIDVPENPYLAVVVAPDDLLTAAEAWAEGEIANVELYDELLAKADDARLVRVLSNLRRASLESHLPLFEAAAAAGGTLDEMPAHTP